MGDMQQMTIADVLEIVETQMNFISTVVLWYKFFIMLNVLYAHRGTWLTSLIKTYSRNPGDNQ